MNFLVNNYTINAMSIMALRKASALTDESLVEMINNSGYTRLFSILHERYNRIVLDRCYRFVKNKEEAKDLAQDIFLTLFVKLKSFQGRSKFSSWFYSFTNNFCVNYLQRNQRMKSRFFHVSINENQISLALNNASEESDDDFSDLRILKLERALKAIDARDRDILKLKYQHNMSVIELQKSLGIKSSAVKMRLKRARLKLLAACGELVE